MPVYCQTMLTTGMLMFGKNVCRRSQNHQWTHDQQQQSRDNERIRPTKRQLDDPHNTIVSARLRRLICFLHSHPLQAHPGFSEN